MEYKIWLHDLVRSYVQEKAVWFTTDGHALWQLECGHIPEVYSTVDFGAGKSFKRNHANHLF